MTFISNNTLRIFFSGKDVQKLRQQQAEQEQIETAKNLRKEREEARLAKERVKEQIARDRSVGQIESDCGLWH